MNKYRNIKVPVKRNGTSQRERLPETLLPNYVLVDERNMDDLIHFVVESAKNLRYFNLENEEDGTWEDFFSGMKSNEYEYPSHQALLMAFLKLFQQSQQHLNTFTKRHLDFYYQEVLKFTKEAAKPDHAHLLFELSRNVQTFLLKANTLFKAGKDNNGKDILYKLAHDTELTQARVANTKVIFLMQGKKDIEVEKEIDDEVVLTTISLEKVNGILAEEYAPNQAFPALGSPSLNNAEIGFALTAPVLSMREGKRTITFSIEGIFDGDEHWLNHLPLAEKLTNCFQLLFSGEEAWIPCSPSMIKIEKDDQDSKLLLTIVAILEKEIAPIVAYNPKKTKWTI